MTQDREQGRRHISRRSALGLLLAPALPGIALAQSASPASGPRASTGVTATAGRIPPPRDGTVDILHGVTVPDPFRPLEDPSRADVQAWVAYLDGEARGQLEGNPLHARVTEFLRDQGRYRRSGGQRPLGTQHIRWVADGVKEQSWLEIAAKPDEPGRPLLDPNTMGADGSVSLWGIYPDRLAQKVAYTTVENGGDAQVLRIRDVRTGLDLLDRLEGCRFTSVAWLAEGNGFYYTRPPLAAETGHDRTSHLLCYHQLGYPQAADRIVYRFPRRTNLYMGISASYTTNQLFLFAGIGTDRNNGFWAGPLADAGLLTMLFPIGRASFRPIRNVGASHYAITDLDAPKGRIVRMTQGDPRTGSWQTIIPEGDGVIDGAALAGNRLVVRRFKDLGHQIAVHDLDGKKVADVPIEGRVRVGFERPDRVANTLVLDVDDRQRPTRHVRIKIETGEIEATTPSAAPHTLADIETREIKARTKYGTEIPVIVMHRPGLARDGTNRTLLYGYGSYGITQWPAYSPLAAAWIRLGGVFAVAHIRGGGEFGREWHQAGRLGKKQTAIDDFHSAAELLVAERITESKRLGIFGASSGGRLVLGAMVQRPELYGAVVAGVPVADMFRFHKHTFGISWTQEYGDPEKAEEFKWLQAISPLHLIKPNVAYPPLMILTADNDQRVVPAHAYKFAAALRDAAPAVRGLCQNPAGSGPWWRQFSVKRY